MPSASTSASVFSSMPSYQDKARLQLNVDKHAGRAHQLEHLAQRGDARVGKAGHAVVGAQRLQLGQRAVFDRARAVGGAVQRFVVDDHQLAVFGQVHVQLDAVRALAGGQLKGGQRVFRRIGACAAVRENFGVVICVPSFLKFGVSLKC